MRSWSIIVTALVAGFVACSDDDGSNIVPNGPPGVGGGGRATAGSGGRGGGGAGGAGAGGRSGVGGGNGGGGGSVGCTVTPEPDAGAGDAGVLDAGALDAGADGGDLDASIAAPRPGRVSFAADLHPIFEQRCAPCHVSVGSGGHNVGGELNAAYDDAVRLGATLVERINGGGMPPSYADPPNNCGGQPGDEGCVTVAEVALVQAWIDQCYPR